MTTGVLGPTFLSLFFGAMLTTASGGNVVVVDAVGEVVVRRTAGRVRSRGPWLLSLRNLVCGADAHAVRQRTITKTGTV